MKLLFFHSRREGRSSSAGENLNRSKNVGDAILNHFDVNLVDHYTRYLEVHGDLLQRFESALANDAKFGQICRDFEAQKVCYLPLTSLILKPLHRILHYELLLERK